MIRRASAALGLVAGIALTLPARAGAFPGDLDPGAIRTVMRAAADWQLAQAVEPAGHWKLAVFYMGLASAAAVEGNEDYWEPLRVAGRALKWAPGPRPLHPDDQAVGQLYLALYERERDPHMLRPMKELFDGMLAGERGIPWSWCDALFMAPPILAQLSRLTGDPRYLDFMAADWRVAAERLYDETHHLYYRDTRRRGRLEENGRLMFWSRGNGWVLAALARVLPLMPETHPDRAWFLAKYRDMAARVAALQPADGLWRPGLLDPDSYRHPESSGSALFFYGIARGVRAGLLDRADYEPVIRRAWAGLVGCVQPDGMVGFVQPPGAGPGPRVKPENTTPYGVGAFLLAAAEAYGLATDQQTKP
ncbi:MAG TPA: glycoside hydrolase family 88 protein [Kiritimatiellia bacterium]|nr:glycoside hydrolase family 88 protein [Kiritimatiellia bacterium]